MARTSVKNLVVDQNVRSTRIYPVEDSINTPCPAKHSKNWKGKSVWLRLTKEEAVHLATVLLAMTQEFDHLDVVGWRLQKRKDGSYPVTVTGVTDSSDEPEE